MPYVLPKGLAYGVFLSFITDENSCFYRIFVSFSAYWYTNHNPENSGILWADPDRKFP